MLPWLSTRRALWGLVKQLMFFAGLVASWKCMVDIWNIIIADPCSRRRATHRNCLKARVFQNSLVYITYMSKLVPVSNTLHAQNNARRRATVLQKMGVPPKKNSCWILDDRNQTIFKSLTRPNIFDCAGGDVLKKRRSANTEIFRPY